MHLMYLLILSRLRAEFVRFLIALSKGIATSYVIFIISARLREGVPGHEKVGEAEGAGTCGSG